MAEFSIIDRYCRGLGASHPQTKLGVGDDAAVIEVPQGMELAISVDSMIEGVHFKPDIAPADLAHKLLAVNLSDMAAMGAHPKWATMTLTTPRIDDAWLRSFSASLSDMADDFGVQLIGGDTSQGKLNLSLQIMGLLPVGKSLKRSEAKIGDDVYVSNNLGDAALALSLMSKGEHTSSALQTEAGIALLNALHRPLPQCELGLALLDIANSCIDVSDGLLADLGHIAQQSRVSIELDLARVPLSSHYRSFFSPADPSFSSPEAPSLLSPTDYTFALSGGDDYELAFTANPTAQDALAALSKQLDVPLSRVGRVVEDTNHTVKVLSNGKPLIVSSKLGYQHFS